jgi:hypothetical protein
VFDSALLCLDFLDWISSGSSPWRVKRVLEVGLCGGLLWGSETPQSRMGALRELSTLLAENADLRADRVPVLASLCPAPEVLKQSIIGAKITGRNLYGILAIAQFLAQSDGGEYRDQLFAIVLDFLRSIPNFPKNTFWPSSFSTEAAKEFFPELLGYVARIASVDSGSSLEVSRVITEVIRRISAGGVGNVEGLLASSNGVKAFFLALGQCCPFLHLKDAEQVVVCLVEHWIQSSYLDKIQGVNASSSSETSGAGSSPKPIGYQQKLPYTNGKRNSFRDVKAMKEAEAVEIQKGDVDNFKSSDFVSPDSTVSTSPDFSPFSTPLDISGELTPVYKSGQLTGRSAEESIFDQLHAIPKSQGAYQGTPGFKMHQRLETESSSALERQEIAYRLLARILERPDAGSALKSLHVEQLRIYASKQLRSILPVLKACFLVLFFLLGE